MSIITAHGSENVVSSTKRGANGRARVEREDGISVPVNRRAISFDNEWGETVGGGASPPWRAHVKERMEFRVVRNLSQATSQHKA